MQKYITAIVIKIRTEEGARNGLQHASSFDIDIKLGSFEDRDSFGVSEPLILKLKSEWLVKSRHSHGSTIMKNQLVVGIVVMTLLGAFSSQTATAQLPNTIFTYQGRVFDNGTNFTGIGEFEFALVNTNEQTGSYTTWWSNDGSSTGGSEPASAVSVGVTNGIFTVALGDTTAPNMTALSTSIFTQPGLQLVIWFNDGINGFAVLHPPQKLTPTPYAILANSASNLLGTLPAGALAGYSGTVSLTNGGNTFAGSFGGNGNGLTNLSASALPPSVPTTASVITANGLTNSYSLAGNVLTVAIGQTNIWPATNAMIGGGIVNAALPVSTCFTNASFTFGPPVNVQPNGYNQPVITVVNSSGSLIAITPNPSWHPLANSVWNCTNNSMITLFIYPGVTTNAACTPIF